MTSQFHEILKILILAGFCYLTQLCSDRDPGRQAEQDLHGVSSHPRFSLRSSVSTYSSFRFSLRRRPSKLKLQISTWTKPSSSFVLPM